MTLSLDLCKHFYPINIIVALNFIDNFDYFLFVNNQTSLLK